MRKIFILILAFSFSLQPLVGFANILETPNNQIIPVYYFQHHTEEIPLGVLVISPISEAEEEIIFQWVYIPINATSSTHFINQFYFKQLSTTTKHIYAGDLLVATIEKPAGIATPVVSYIHTDHLGSTNVVSNSSGSIVETLDYFPYGSLIIDDKSGAYTGERRKFTGHEYDQVSQLSFMEARYQNGSQGRFLSQDEVFLATGNIQEVENNSSLKQEQYLSNPQFLNSYSYAGNNPLKYKDNSGKFLDVAIDVGFTLYSAYKLGGAVLSGDRQAIKSESINFGLDAGGLLVPGAFGIGSLRRVGGNLNEARKISERFNWSDPRKLFDHFSRHGSSFGAQNAADYARKAMDFLDFSRKNNLPTKVDSQGIIRVYDPKSNTFGSYNPDGSVKTFFKPDPSVHGRPTNLDYWRDQAGK